MPVNPSTGKPNQPDKEKKAPPPILVRSTPRATLWERLKEVKKKDLAFIAAGLLTLISAPLAQHYFMQPGGDQLLEPGFSTREGAGKTPYDGGLNMLSDGGPVGGEVITPVSGRDPSSLLMPPGGPPAPAKPAPAAGGQEGIRDALNRALSASAPKAAEAAALPQPRASLASALRGLAALAGASYGGGASGPLLGQGVLQAAQHVPSRPAPRNYAGPLPLSGYQGPAQGLNSASKEAIEALKNQAGKAADQFNRTGNGVNDLNNAARDSINPGGTGINTQGPADSAFHASPGNQFPPPNISLGEGLAYLAAKMRMEKAIELEFKKRELMEMLPYKIFETGMNKIFGAIGDWAAKSVGEMLDPPDPDASKYSCCQGQLAGSTNPDPATCSAPTKGTPVGSKLYVKIAGSGDKDPGSQGDMNCPGGIVPAWVWKAWQTNPSRQPGGGKGPNAGGPDTPQVSGVSHESPVGPAYLPEPYWPPLRDHVQKTDGAVKGAQTMVNQGKAEDLRKQADGLKALIKQAVDESSAAAGSAGLLSGKTAEFYTTISLDVNGDAGHYGIDQNVQLVDSLVTQADERIKQTIPKVDGIKPKSKGGTFDHLNAETFYNQANAQVTAARGDLKQGQDGLGALKQKQTELHAVDGRAAKAKDATNTGAAGVAQQANAIAAKGEEANKLVDQLVAEDKPAKAEALKTKIGASVKEMNTASDALGKASESEIAGSTAFKPEVGAFDKAYGAFNKIGPGIEGAVDADPARGMLGQHLYATDTGAEAIVAKSTQAQTAGTQAKK